MNQAGKTAAALDPIWEEIWKRRPILGEIMRKHGEKNLFEYTKDFLDVNPSPVLDARKHEFFAITHEMAEEAFGADVADGIVDQLKKLPLVSTTDHHATLQHPFFLNSNIVSNLPAYGAEDTLKYLVVLSFSSTSLNNSSAFARGLLFHGDKRGSHDLNKLSFFGDKEKMATTYNTRPYTREDLDRSLEQLGKKEKEGTVTPERSAKIRELIETYFAQEDVLKASDLCLQLSKVNFRLWPKYFHPKDDHLADLAYLDIETMVREILLRYHLNNPDSLIYKVLFNKEYFPLVLKHFNGIPGAFSVEKEWGTYMFWALDDKNHRVRLTLDADHKNIASQQRTCVFATEPEAIAEALRTRKIFPGMFLCYLVVSLYYGMKCLGGFSQVNDLTKSKEKWQEFLREIGENAEADAVEPVQTKELGGDGMVLAYLKTLNGELIPATGVDLFMEEDPIHFERLVELSKTIQFKEIMAPMVPEIYKVLFSEEERNPDFLTLTPEEIMQFTGLQEKISKFY